MAGLRRLLAVLAATAVALVALVGLRRSRIEEPSCGNGWHELSGPELL